MTPEQLAKEPLKRGDILHHPALGVCLYAGKVRSHPELIAVTYSHMKGAQEIRVKVKLDEVTRTKKAGKKQGASLILAYCPDCECKIRVTRFWLEKGTPRCFNRECPGGFEDAGGAKFGREMEIEWGENGDGKIGIEGWRGGMREGDIRNATRRDMRDGYETSDDSERLGNQQAPGAFPDDE
jgi:hypothetical protein